MVMETLGQEAGWESVQGEYRKLLYERGLESGMEERTGQRGFTPEELRKVLEQGGRLSLQQALHCRVRYFTDGLILGTRAYVDEVFGRYPERFSPKRASGARRVAGVDLGDLCTARRLRLDSITVPVV